jgi:hypothetical protein
VSSVCSREKRGPLSRLYDDNTDAVCEVDRFCRSVLFGDRSEGAEAEYAPVRMMCGGQTNVAKDDTSNFGQKLQVFKDK